MASEDLVQRKSDLQNDIELRKHELKNAVREVRTTARQTARIPVETIQRRPVVWTLGLAAVGVLLGLIRTLQRRQRVRVTFRPDRRAKRLAGRRGPKLTLRRLIARY